MHLYEELNFDAWARGQEEARDNLFLVAIDDNSHLHDFGLRSPLDQAKIQRLLLNVIDGGASVVGVDLDTRDWEPDLFRQLPPDAIDRVVWARIPLGESRATLPQRQERYRELTGLQRCHGSVVLANSDVTHLEMANLTGMIRTLPQPAMIDGDRLPPLGELVAERGAGTPRPNGCFAEKQNHSGSYIRFLSRDGSGRPHVPIVSARDVLGGGNYDFRGGIVLIGGTFQDSGDYVPTPYGRQPALFVHADVAHTHLAGGGYRAWTSTMYLGLDVLLGSMIVLFGWMTRFRHGLFWFGILTTILCSLLFSLTVFEWGSEFVSFWPVVVGVGLHEGLEKLAPGYWKRIISDLRTLLSGPKVDGIAGTAKVSSSLVAPIEAEDKTASPQAEGADHSPPLTPPTDAPAEYIPAGDVASSPDQQDPAVTHDYPGKNP